MNLSLIKEIMLIRVLREWEGNQKYVIHCFLKYFLFKNIFKYYFIKSILSKQFF
jgi:hypothetical protein